MRVARSATGDLSAGTFFTFIVGAGHVRAWLDEVVRDMTVGSAVKICSVVDDAMLSLVVLLRIVYTAEEVSPRPAAVLNDTVSETSPLGLQDNGMSESSASRAQDDIEEHLDEINSSEHCTVPVVLSENDCLEKASRARLNGNAIVATRDVSRKKLREALQHYHAGLYWNKRGNDVGSGDFRIRTYLNIALVLIKLEDWRMVLLYCDAVLQEDTKNAKAFFRRGMAHSRLSLFAPALRDLSRALELAPDDPVIKKELDDTKVSSAKLLKRTRQQFAEVYNVMVQSPIYNIS